MKRSQDGWIECYERKGALWIHDGNADRPHALLTSGLHSSGFFNSELVMEDSYLLDEACADLVETLETVCHSHRRLRVVGPAMGAITLADGLARHLAEVRLPSGCLRAYTEKEGEGENLKMVFKRTTIHEGEEILLCEDVLTTGGSVGRAVKAVEEAKGIVLPYIAILVNRSGLSEVDGRKIVALIDCSMPMWAAEECPLCKQDSEAIRPKGKENWARLKAKY
jgi:orotate phosphoribosyltransferase